MNISRNRASIRLVAFYGNNLLRVRRGNRGASALRLMEVSINPLLLEEVVDALDLLWLFLLEPAGKHRRLLRFRVGGWLRFRIGIGI